MPRDKNRLGVEFSEYKFRSFFREGSDDLMKKNQATAKVESYVAG
jgi:hypothetical protein